MTSSEFDKPIAHIQTRFEKVFSTCGQPRETDRSMQVLARLARTLGVPIEAFFEEPGRTTPSEDGSAGELAELNRAFLAIVDPIMRRRCLDLVRAASGEPALPRTRPSDDDA